MPHDTIDNLTTIGADTPQRKLGKYLLQRLLGRGGMGEVWLARDTLADIEVALKMLPPDLRHSEEAQDQIRSSYQRVHRLGHPHICAVKDLVTDPGTGYFLVMDYFEGVTLSKYRAKQGWMTVAEVVRLLTPVAQALDYAHSLKLAHRDIKPGNILVSEDGQQVRVIDFQLASEIRASVGRFTGKEVKTSGTYPYMAPEQFLGQRASAQTDLYALAMVAYELLDGQLPYEADSLVQWKSIVTDERSVLPKIDDIPPAAQLALEAGLSSDKSRRTGTCSQWLQSLMSSASNVVAYTTVDAPAAQELWTPAESRVDITEVPNARSTQIVDEFAGSVAGETRRCILPGGVPLEFQWCPAGEFTMKEPSAVKRNRGYFVDGTPSVDRTDCNVQITNGFWLGKYVVTQAQWKAVVGNTPWTARANEKTYKSGYKKLQLGDLFPATYISYEEALSFCEQINGKVQSEKFVPDGWIFTLPTEAEWEYSCRAGTETDYFFDETQVLTREEMTFEDNAKNRGYKYAHAVPRQKANDLGLCGMHGNVSEWCLDAFDSSLPGGVDPVVMFNEIRGNAVIRGGSWDKPALNCASGYRDSFPRSRTSYDIGFRVAIVLSTVERVNQVNTAKQGSGRDRRY